ncbi:MAG TPA: hypothetical protein VF022_05310 [Rhodanobacteraceae bacterium]
MHQSAAGWAGWRHAEARSSDGQDVDLVIDPTDGSVIASKPD